MKWNFNLFFVLAIFYCSYCITPSACMLEYGLSPVSVQSALQSLQHMTLGISSLMQQIFSTILENVLAYMTQVPSLVDAMKTRVADFSKDEGPLMNMYRHANFGNIATFTLLFLLPLATLSFSPHFMPLTVVKSTFWLFGLDFLGPLALKGIILLSLEPLLETLGDFNTEKIPVKERTIKTLSGVNPAAIGYQIPCYIGFLVSYIGLLWNTQSVIWFMLAEFFAQLGALSALYSDSSIQHPLQFIAAKLQTKQKRKLI